LVGVGVDPVAVEHCVRVETAVERAPYWSTRRTKW